MRIGIEQGGGGIGHMRNGNRQTRFTKRCERRVELFDLFLGEGVVRGIFDVCKVRGEPFELQPRERAHELAQLERLRKQHALAVGARFELDVNANFRAACARGRREPARGRGVEEDHA